MSNQTILLVEDNPDDEILALRALKMNNVANRVVVAHDGQEAIDFIFKTGPYESQDKTDLPQLILLDLNLPKIGGIDVLKKIRSDKNHNMIPIVILTTSKEESDLIDSYKLGANSYIRKPVDFKQFSNAVQQLGIYWLILNEPPPYKP